MIEKESDFMRKNELRKRLLAVFENDNREARRSNKKCFHEKGNTFIYPISSSVRR